MYFMGFAENVSMFLKKNNIKELLKKIRVGGVHAQAYRVVLVMFIYSDCSV